MAIYFKLYPLIIGLQIFCLYHAFKNKADYKWFWFIIIFPLIGAIVYIYHHFYSKENISNLTEGVKGVVNSNYEIKKLEKELEFNDSVRNKIKLSDKYYELGRHEESLILLKESAEISKNDSEIIQKLIRTYFSLKNYKLAIENSKKIKGKTEFIDSHEHIMLAWSYFNLDEIEKAEKEFKDMDGLFCNYSNRLEYAKFLNQIGEKEKSLDKTELLISELNQMNSQERKSKKNIFKLIKQFHLEL